jgi:type IV secretory pathway VirJ component
MKINKPLLIFLLLIVTLIGFWLVGLKNPPVLQKTIRSESFGDISVTQPLWGSKGLVLVFVDTKKFAVKDLHKRLSATRVTAAVVDPLSFFKGFTEQTGHCLDAQQVATAIESLIKALPAPSVNHQIVAGIGEGALIPFINAQFKSANAATNLSIGFSVTLPDSLVLCPSLSGEHKPQKNSLTSSPGLLGKWRSVWSDQPAPETGVFIRSLANVDTRIAAYDTPLDTLLIDELNSSLGQTSQTGQSPPMPVVEVPVSKPTETVTIFYSGDGGWRDLDRTIAGEMAALNYPVVGVDVLRYFWEHKTPEQAAVDLSATMAYYRQHWGTKSFVLAGYSFGADILPSIYNRLPATDRDNVELLVLLALANQADFEIHVAGWLGRSGNEQPLAPELAQISKNKIFCVYGLEEKAETACTSFLNTEAKILELPGGHHFDEDYPKLTRKILDRYRELGIN